MSSADQDGEYGEAWTLASTHRVDLNLLVDYNWPGFLSQVECIVTHTPWAAQPGAISSLSIHAS